MTWIVFALLAAVLWGASYAMYGELVKSMSPAATTFYSSVGMLVVYAGWMLSSGALHNDWQLLKKGGGETKLVLSLIAVNALANIFLALSIKEKNPTAAGLIEISYPLFTALFAWIFWKEMQFTLGTALGGALIMAGIACIAFFEKTAQ